MIKYIRIIEVLPSGKNCWVEVEINGVKTKIKKKLSRAKELINQDLQPNELDEIINRVSKVTLWDRISYYIRGLLGRRLMK